jgi:hypothetical protein
VTLPIERNAAPCTDGQCIAIECADRRRVVAHNRRELIEDAIGQQLDICRRGQLLRGREQCGECLVRVQQPGLGALALADLLDQLRIQPFERVGSIR